MCLLCDGRTPSTLPFQQVTCSMRRPPCATPIEIKHHALMVDGNGTWWHELFEPICGSYPSYSGAIADPRIQTNYH